MRRQGIVTQYVTAVTVTSPDGTSRPAKLDTLSYGSDGLGTLEMVGPLAPDDVVTIETSSGTSVSFRVAGVPVSRVPVVLLARADEIIRNGDDREPMDRAAVDAALSVYEKYDPYELASEDESTAWLRSRA